MTDSSTTVSEQTTEIKLRVNGVPHRVRRRPAACCRTACATTWA